MDMMMMMIINIYTLFLDFFSVLFIHFKSQFRIHSIKFSQYTAMSLVLSLRNQVQEICHSTNYLLFDKNVK